MIVLQDDGTYALRRPANLVMIESDSPSAVERLTSLVVQHLCTAIQNFQAPDHASKHIERNAHVAHLPAKYLPEFRKLTKQQGQNFLDVIDVWLTQRNCPDSDEPTVEAGVHVYAYNGETTSTRYSTRGRKRRH